MQISLTLSDVETEKSMKLAWKFERFLASVIYWGGCRNEWKMLFFWIDIILPGFGIQTDTRQHLQAHMLTCYIEVPKFKSWLHLAPLPVPACC